MPHQGASEVGPFQGPRQSWPIAAHVGSAAAARAIARPRQGSWRLAAVSASAQSPGCSAQSGRSHYCQRHAQGGRICPDAWGRWPERRCEDAGMPHPHEWPRTRGQSHTPTVPCNGPQPKTIAPATDALRATSSTSGAARASTNRGALSAAKPPPGTRPPGSAQPWCPQAAVARLACPGRIGRDLQIPCPQPCGRSLR